MDIKSILEKEFATESALKESNSKIVLNNDSLSIDSFLNKHKEYQKKIGDALRLYEANKKEAASKYQARLELEKKEGKQEVIYQSSIDSLNSGKYYEAYMGFASILDYKDSKDYHSKCDAILDVKYKEAKDLFDKKQYSDALAVFKILVAYKDSADMIRRCESAIEEQKKQEKRNAQIAAQNAAKKKKKKIILSVSGVVAGIVTLMLILTFTVFVPTANKKANQAKYENALRLINSGNYLEAVEELSNLNYADSAKQLLVAKAGLSFEGNNYDTGLKNMCDAGGTTEVTYNPNGGVTSIAKETITSYKKITNTSSKDYYTFNDWDVENFKITTSENNYNCDLKLAANFGATVYRITYSLDGGTNSSSNPSTYTIESQTIMLQDPSKTGYKFKGWTLNGNACTSIPKGSHGDITLVATWTKIYNITYVLNGGTNDSTNPSSFTVEDTFTIKDATREGYTFIGWNDGTSTSKNYVISNRTSNLTLTAVWEANVYVVTLDPDGGTIDGDTVRNITYDSNPSLPTPVKEYHSFEGWYYGDTKIGSTWKIASNCTIKAKWKIPCLEYLTYTKVSNSYIKITGVSSNVTELVIPETIDGKPVTEIAANAFQNDTSIQVVVLPDSITKIGEYAFNKCTSLTTLILSKNLSSIGAYTFIGCSSLQTIKTKVDSSTNFSLAYLFTTISQYISDSQMVKYPASLTNIIVTSGSVVPSKFFAHLPSTVTNVQFVDGITEVKDYGFWNCKNYLFPNSIVKIGEYSYSDLGTIGDSFTVHEGLKEIGAWAFSGSYFKTVNLPSTLTSIGRAVFAGGYNTNNVLKTINFNGTKAKWQSLTDTSSSYDSWAYNLNNSYTVYCTDAYYVRTIYGGTWYDL